MMQDLPNLRIGKNVKDSLIRPKVASKWHTILPQYENQRQGIQLRLVPFAAYLISCRFLPPKTEFMCGLDSPLRENNENDDTSRHVDEDESKQQNEHPQTVSGGRGNTEHRLIYASDHPLIHSCFHGFIPREFPARPARKRGTLL